MTTPDGLFTDYPDDAHRALAESISAQLDEVREQVLAANDALLVLSVVLELLGSVETRLVALEPATNLWTPSEVFGAYIYDAGPFVGPWPNQTNNIVLPAPDTPLPTGCVRLGYAVAHPTYWTDNTNFVGIVSEAYTFDPPGGPTQSYDGGISGFGTSDFTNDSPQPDGAHLLVHWLPDDTYDQTGAYPSVADPTTLIPAGWI